MASYSALYFGLQGRSRSCSPAHPEVSGMRFKPIVYPPIVASSVFPLAAATHIPHGPMSQFTSTDIRRCDMLTSAGDSSVTTIPVLMEMILKGLDVAVESGSSPIVDIREDQRGSCAHSRNLFAVRMTPLTA